MNRNRNQKKKLSAKQIAALLGILLLVALYIGALVAAILDPSAGGRLFQIALVASTALPFLLWIGLWLISRVRKGAEDEANWNS